MRTISHDEGNSGNFGNDEGNNEGNDEGNNEGNDEGNTGSNNERKFMMFVRKILALATALFVCVGILGCAQADLPQEPASLDFSTNGAGDPNTPKPVPDFEETKHIIASAKLNPALMYQSNESIDEGDLTFSNPKCYRSDELPSNISVDKIVYSEGDLAEGASHLADGKEHLFVDLEIENLSSVATIFNVGSLSCVFADNDLIEVSDSGELRYFSAGEDKESKSYYNLPFAPNEKKTITLGYVVDKSLLDTCSIYFPIAEGGGTATVSDNPAEPVDDYRSYFALQV